jgi:septum formation protein
MSAEVQHAAVSQAAPRIILASQSPRRRDLLSLIGIPHTVRPADIDETVRLSERPIACVERLAREKAERIAGTERRSAGDTVIIAADTIVVIDDRILNKPVDVADARAMLRVLQGRTHAVHTAVCVVRGARHAAGLASVRVRFRPLRDDEIDAYIATGEPMDKAGAYGIQGYGATIVDHIDGDFFAVMGLPLVTLVRLLADVGIEYRFGEMRDAGVGGGRLRARESRKEKGEGRSANRKKLG